MASIRFKFHKFAQHHIMSENKMQPILVFESHGETKSLRPLEPFVCHACKSFLSKVQKLTSDNEFLAIMFYCRGEAGKMFSIL